MVDRHRGDTPPTCHSWDRRYEASSMADTVDTAFVPAFQNVIVGLYAEDPDQLQSTVRLRTGVVGKTDHWERLGGVRLVPVTSRHKSPPHPEMCIPGAGPRWP